jgi:hypothetical protein
MSEEKNSATGLWTVVGAIGGLASGIAAILALFITQPSTINVLIPQQALDQARAAAGHSSSGSVDGDGLVNASTGALTPPLAPVTAQPAVTVERPAPASRPLSPGLNVALISIADQENRFVATLRFANATGGDVGIAVERSDFSGGQFRLSDGAGGSCQMIANGEGWGTLGAVDAERSSYAVGTEDFRALPSGEAQHTIFFNKGRCDTPIDANQPLSISGTFVITTSTRRQTASVAFNDILIYR